MARCFAGAKCELASVARSLAKQTRRSLDCNAAAAPIPFSSPIPSHHRSKLHLQSEAPCLLLQRGVAAGHFNRTSLGNLSSSGVKLGQSVEERKWNLVSASMQASVQTAAKVGARESGSVPLEKLVEVVTNAAKTGAAVVMDRVDKPRTVDFKGATDLVTDTDKATEEAILEVIKEAFPDHLVLGEEGGVSGGPNSDYLWCIDPLDGTTNFAHSYPCFAVSVAVLWKGRPIAGSVVEFAGGPFCWVTRTFSATAGGGAFCEGQRIHVSDTESVQRSLLVTGFGYEHDDAWATNIELFKHFTDVTRGVRRLGAAAVDLCHVALGLVDAYWEYRLKPWDVAAGVLIAEEAGALVTRMDGKDFTVFDRSVIASNGKIHPQLLDVIRPATQKLLDSGKFVDDLWFKPDGYQLK
ncbi:Inositol monophosphatase [Klebsormidium nitens]|uniref:inositol-phosphate phosphatase n=1 Tax=Klebsormidium nitens TaxID=105231 RepID=A0A1Y1IIS1_KLENI|nr:Inositol monophosphatase [Klebsormidium nitens]|eukprot:GAQ90760.1 Inositol monophosphatase [Klebsormidium nitens]